MFETLETRTMLSNSFDTSTGILTVTGTAKPDTIEFGGGTTILVRMTSSGTTTSESFDALKVTKIIVNALDGSDTVVVGKVPIPFVINGGKGNDKLSAGPANDTILGGGGDDYIFGGDGKDRLDGGSQGDDMFGGGGKDAIDYSSRVGNLTVGLGALPDDGEAGEGDNVRTDIEIIFCGSGNDKVSTTSSKSIEIYGYAGNDTLNGGSGNDYLDGGAGNDLLIGGGGDDVFKVKDGAKDSVIGGSGIDTADADATDSLTEM